MYVHISIHVRAIIVHTYAGGHFSKQHTYVHTYVCMHFAKTMPCQICSYQTGRIKLERKQIENMKMTKTWIKG